ncbi:MAG TPA: folylpolyglutamate synthase/dihydrofolate synthase family protein [Longimicrobiales bacterium]|nr:folylpolyglutamate synthase/dihydrofolate synthase family protein [Longimicrobiales bacterium]
MTPASPAAESPRDAAPERLDRPFLDPLFDRLFPPLPAGVHWGLERVQGALAELGDPQDAAPALHVGGTNGKGSVAATLASVLSAAGHRVGLYTSPHLCSLTERFQLNGHPVAEELLIQAADEIRGVVVRHGLTFFEASTVLAFHLFAREAVDRQVVEVGLGGRLDATNVLVPQVSVLTNVAMDHADFLGDTLSAIAREKAGILKAGVPAVTAETGPEALSVFREVADTVGAPLHLVDAPREVRQLEVAEDHTSFTLETEVWGSMRLWTPLVGEHQASNTALAVRALELLPSGARPLREAILAGVATVRWPGRDQIQNRGGVRWLFDVAHNTAGVHSLTGVVDRLDLPRPRVALIGVLGDKEWDQMLPPLLDRVDGAILTQPPSAPQARRWDPRAAAERVRGALEDGTRKEGGFLVVRPDFEAALEEAARRAPGGTVVVTGSCHTVGDALRLLHLDPFPAG